MKVLGYVGALAISSVILSGCDFLISANGEDDSDSSDNTSATAGDNSSWEICREPRVLSILSASDDGSYDEGYQPALTIDTSLSDDARWSSEGGSKWIMFDLDNIAKITDIAIAFYNGSERSSYFYIETSADSTYWTSVFENGVSGGASSDFEVFDVTDSEARYVRITGAGNSVNLWNSYLEVEAYGCSSVEEADSGSSPDTDSADADNTDSDSTDSDAEIPVVGDLDPTQPPSFNFELDDWYLSIPTDTDGNGKSDDIKEGALTGGYENNEYFYTAADGGMVFKTPIDGYKTSTSTDYTRTELREMLRRGGSIETEGVNKNNWVFGSASEDARTAAGGVDGILRATLAVNHVTTTGDIDQVGRVIVGQIHANNDEPLRLYYRKLPGHTKGSIYYAHEPITGSEQWIEIIGERSNSASDPEDGIALDEVFSYEIKVVGNMLYVTIMRAGKDDIMKDVDMSSSGFDADDQYHYFKLGVYNQNKTGDADDYVQATFYAFENKHTGYDF